jgi:glycosyltransferase involved in cell wall biosynthesis
MKQNLLIVWDRIGDYHAVRFTALESEYGKGHVFIADIGGADALYKWQNPLKTSAQYRSLSEKPVEESDAGNRLRNFKNLVRENNISVVGIAGYGRPEYRQMMHWCRLKGIRIILFAESWYPGRLDFMKGLYLRFLCQGFLVSGIRAREHFKQRLGIPADKIRLPYSVVDNAHFSSVKPDYSIRKILCLARFSPEKNLEKLMLAFQKSGIARQGWSLELVGGGPQKQELLSNKIDGVHFRDWVSYAELPALYGSASAFVLPSSFEPWGLVVNEAMAAGLPVLVSEECGCAPDLVADKGFRFGAQHGDNMARVLRELADLKPNELQRIGEENRKRIAEFSPEEWAKSFLKLAMI